MKHLIQRRGYCLLLHIALVSCLMEPLLLGGLFHSFLLIDILKEFSYAIAYLLSVCNTRLCPVILEVHLSVST